MALSDAQIDRFSRQIILPQIGGAGQQRLLRSSVAIGGSDDALAEVVALYLAGAGIGRIALHGTDRTVLRAALVDLDPDVCVSLSSAALGGVAADVLIACNPTVPEIDRAVTAGGPLIVGGTRGAWGWLVVVEGSLICARCAARSAIAERPVVESPHPVPLPAGEGTTQAAREQQGSLSRRERDRVRGFDDCEPPQSPLASSVTGVVGSLMALAAVKLRLGLGPAPGRVWMQFDAGHSTLTEQPIARAADCPTCAAA